MTIAIFKKIVYDSFMKINGVQIHHTLIVYIPGIGPASLPTTVIVDYMIEFSRCCLPLRFFY